MTAHYFEASAFERQEISPCASRYYFQKTRGVDGWKDYMPLYLRRRILFLTGFCDTLGARD